MAETPLISIVTVTKDNLDGLRRTHASLQSQSDPDLEWIVIDGASRDGSIDFLKKTNALWSSAADNGIYDAMNKGLERASGRYIWFLNAGDRLAAPDNIADLKAAVDNMPAPFALLYGHAYESDRDGRLRLKRARMHTSIARGLFTHHQAILYARAAIGDLRYNPAYKIAGDYDFTARLLQAGATALMHPFPICIFESGGLSQQKPALGRREEFQIKRNLGLGNPAQNRLTYLRQYAAAALKNAAPGLYWRLRSAY